ncbi:MAG: DUF2147 domain-containing protein [Alphaproteobacteria bacterium]|nr:DUF2147 domain-containing protein [Alphaproteobacteria bacterium]
MKKLCLFLMITFLSLSAFANEVTGFWTTIDDETKEAKSVVEIYEKEGKIFGKVVEIFGDKEAKAAILGSPKILGLEIIKNMVKKGSKYKNGTILDPKKGKTYSCELWREGDNLIVRGKIAFLGRNQTWHKNTSFKAK